MWWEWKAHCVEGSVFKEIIVTRGITQAIRSVDSRIQTINVES